MKIPQVFTLIRFYFITYLKDKSALTFTNEIHL